MQILLSGPQTVRLGDCRCIFSISVWKCGNNCDSNSTPELMRALRHVGLFFKSVYLILSGYILISFCML